MSNNNLTLNQQSVRGTDSNSLLRLYDQANELVTTSLSQQERVRAGKVVERIARELQRREVPVDAGHKSAAAQGTLQGRFAARK